MPDENGFYKLTPTKYTTRAYLKRSTDKQIIFRHGHIAICDYRMGDNPEFEKSLQYEGRTLCA